MTGFLQRLMSGNTDPQWPEAEAGNGAELKRDLAAAQTRISELEGDLEGMEAELAKAEVERDQIETLTEDMAASQVRAAATVADLTRAKSELEGMNDSLAERDQKLKLALKQANDSNQEKDHMFSAVTKAIEEINECLSIASSSCEENAKASRAAGIAADSAMAEATDMAQRAGEIIDVSSAIRAVADRTRLLSLNAKIEASKAQEFGRGFSVVADEVKKLSQEASEASERIARVAGAIEKSTKAVRDLIGEVRETTSDVNTSSERIVETASRQEIAINELLVKIGEKHSGEVDLF